MAFGRRHIILKPTGNKTSWLFCRAVAWRTFMYSWLWWRSAGCLQVGTTHFFQGFVRQQKTRTQAESIQYRKRDKHNACAGLKLTASSFHAHPKCMCHSANDTTALLMEDWSDPVFRENLLILVFSCLANFQNISKGIGLIPVKTKLFGAKSDKQSI